MPSSFQPPLQRPTHRHHHSVPYTTTHHRQTLLAMSGFLSSEAEQALMGNEEDAQRLFEVTTFPPGASLEALTGPASTPMVDDNAIWAHEHTSSSGLDYFHPYPVPLGPSSAFSYPPGTHMDPGIGSSAMALSASRSSAGYYSSSSSPELLQSQLPSVGLGGFPPGIPTLPSSASDPYLNGDFSTPPRPSMAMASRSASHTGTSGVETASSSRSATPHPPDLSSYGTLNHDARTWTCAYPGCASRAIFARPCDLRKHFRRHNKHFFCRHEACPQATQGGFSSKKDRARHEAKHNPGVECEWEGCERVFSRVDNMRNHMQRIHLKQK